MDLITKLLDDLKQLLTNLFSNMERAWNHLSPEVKDALQKAVTIMSVVNANLTATPQFLIDIIQKILPSVDIPKLQAALATITKDITGLAAVPTDSLETTIENLQKYFAGLGKAEWEQKVSMIAQQLAYALSPDGTPFSIISMFTEFAHNKFPTSDVPVVPITSTTTTETAAA